MAQPEKRTKLVRDTKNPFPNYITTRERRFFLEVASHLYPALLADLAELFIKYRATLRKLDKIQLSWVYLLGFERELKLSLSSLRDLEERRKPFNKMSAEDLKVAKRELKQRVKFLQSVETLRNDLETWRNKYHLWEWSREYALLQFKWWQPHIVEQITKAYKESQSVPRELIVWDWHYSGAVTKRQPFCLEFRGWPDANNPETWEQYERRLNKVFREAKQEYRAKQLPTYQGFETVTNKIEKHVRWKHFAWAALVQVGGVKPQYISEAQDLIGNSATTKNIKKALEEVFHLIASSQRKLSRTYTTGVSEITNDLAEKLKAFSDLMQPHN